jgi:hypothetical protein
LVINFRDEKAHSGFQAAGISPVLCSSSAVRITGDQMNKDSWTFSIDLDKDELLRDTTEDSRSKRVEWAGGASASM